MNVFYVCAIDLNDVKVYTVGVTLPLSEANIFHILLFGDPNFYGCSHLPIRLEGQEMALAMQVPVGNSLKSASENTGLCLVFCTL